MPSCVNGRREHRSARKRRITGSWTACGREKLSVDDDSAAVSPTLPIMVSMTRRMDSKTGVAASSHKDEPDTESKAIQTRRRILDAAAYVLSTKGYAGLRLTHVAERADLDATAIYYNFPSRDDLIEHVMWVGIADTREHVCTVLQALPADTPAIDRFLAAVDAHLRHGLQISDYGRASVRNAGQVPTKIRRHHMQEHARYREVWRRLLTEITRSGQLRDATSAITSAPTDSCARFVFVHRIMVLLRETPSRRPTRASQTFRMSLVCARLPAPPCR
jgi:TetR/AcrR family transcriptional regulator, cholesterol catabolism regulator